MTKLDALYIYYFDPVPMKNRTLMNYIVTAIQEHDSQYFNYSTHYNENRLNSFNRHFLIWEWVE